MYGVILSQFWNWQSHSARLDRWPIRSLVVGCASPDPLQRLRDPFTHTEAQYWLIIMSTAHTAL